MEILLGALAVAVAYTFSSLRILKQYERGVTLLLGNFWAPTGRCQSCKDITPRMRG